MLSATYSELLRGNRNYRRLWIGQMISELGTWFSFIAELGLVRVLSGSPLATTALLVARTMPFFLAGPLAGVIVDKRSRKQIMIAADLLRAGVALLYLAAAWTGAVWAVVACSALMSSLTMFFEAAKNAALPNMVTPRELLTANVLMFSTRFLQFTLGAALGGLTAAQFGYKVAFIVNALSFGGSAIYIALIPSTAMRRAPAVSARAAEGAKDDGEAVQGRFFQDLRDGLAYIWTTPFVRGVILVNIGWATGGGMINLLFDRVGGQVFAGEGNRGDWNVAALFTAGGAGLFVGMMLARRAGAWAAQERRAGLFIGWSLLAHGIFLAVGGLMPTLALMALWVAASRMILGMEFGVQETMMMRVLPDEYRGRVFSTDRALEISMMTVSTVIGGWLLIWLDPRTLMVMSGLLSAIPGVAWLLALWLTRFGVPAGAVRQSYGD
ncbi:MAG TPA: MFS transporter [Blastocatellia bacterium]|jgi:MFS family permease|nr:MFS transporter [Blastocatellia bacterium]